jgi:hypothetical protein
MPRLLAAAVLLLSTSAAAAPLATVTDIDRACDAAERTADVKRARVFASLSEEDEWQDFASTRALERAARQSELHAQAFLWPAVEGVTAVELLFDSESGDWSHFANLCYRPDGSLARLVDTLNTWYTETEDSADQGGPVSRVHTKHFDERGHRLRARAAVLDLESRRPVRRSFMDQDDHVFKCLGALPFGHLLATHAPK